MLSTRRMESWNGLTVHVTKVTPARHREPAPPHLFRNTPEHFATHLFLPQAPGTLITFSLQACLVHTSETIRVCYFMERLMALRRPVMLVGAAGTGKSVLVGSKLASLDTEEHLVKHVPFNYYTTSAMLQGEGLGHMEGRVGVSEWLHALTWSWSKALGTCLAPVPTLLSCPFLSPPWHLCFTPPAPLAPYFFSSHLLHSSLVSYLPPGPGVQYRTVFSTLMPRKADTHRRMATGL